MRACCLRPLLLCLFVLILQGCGGSAVRHTDLTSPVVGIWHGEIFKPKLGYLLTWVHNVRADGTYRDTFVHIYHDGNREESTESGTWRIDGQSYFEIVSGTMRKPDEYKILMLSDHYFILQLSTQDAATLSPGIGTIYVHRK